MRPIYEKAESKRKETAKSFIAANTDKALALLKNSYFPQYPQAQKYSNIQRAFEKFFERPTWEIQQLTNGWNVVFNGVALINNQRARFTWIFPILASEVERGRIDVEATLSVNGNPDSLHDINNILAAVFLN